MSNISLIEEAVNTAPLSLLALSTRDLEEANKFLPYSIGMEFETPLNMTLFEGDMGRAKQVFSQIPFIMSVDLSHGEQRLRIPNGVKGLLCLYSITDFLKTYCEFNHLSGIHYHVDMTHSYNVVASNLTPVLKEYVLKELEKEWNPGTYNPRGISDTTAWVRKQSGFKTFEFRIGEMTFDYALLIKRIRHASGLIKYLNTSFGIQDPSIPVITVEEKRQFVNFISSGAGRNLDALELSALKNELDKLTKSKNFDYTPEEKDKILKSRIIKVKL